MGKFIGHFDNNILMLTKNGKNPYSPNFLMIFVSVNHVAFSILLISDLYSPIKLFSICVQNILFQMEILSFLMMLIFFYLVMLE